MSNDILRPEAPALPLARNAFNRRWIDDYSNILRLFFNRLVGTIRQLLSPDSGGAALYFPHGAFLDANDQLPVGAGVQNIVRLTTESIQNNIRLENDSRVVFEKSGVYDVRFLGNVITAGSTTDQIAVWIVINGTTFGSSAQIKTIVAETTIEIANFVSVVQGDYIEIAWFVTSADISLSALITAGTIPSVPSARLQVAYVSNQQ